MIQTISIQDADHEAPAGAASDAEETSPEESYLEESYLVWGAGLIPPFFVRPVFVRRTS